MSQIPQRETRIYLHGKADEPLATAAYKTTYHFEIVYDDSERKWHIRTDFEGIPLQMIFDGRKWRDPIMDSERKKIQRRLDDLRTALDRIEENKPIDGENNEYTI